LSNSFTSWHAFLFIFFIVLLYKKQSGIDIRKRNSDNKEIVKKFEVFIKKSKLFLLVTDVNNAKKDDTLFLQFIQHLQFHSVRTPVALIISKWDELTSNSTNHISLDDFVGYNMEHIDKKMRTANLNYKGVFAFSVGDVDSGIIKELKVDNCSQVATWIYDSLIIE